jgi:hypothetical protein
MSGMDDLTYVTVGFDRFRAQVIAESCRAAGLEVRLLASDDSGYGPVQPHRLLVRSDDLEEVLAVVEKSDSAGHPDQSIPEQ